VIRGRAEIYYATRQLSGKISDGFSSSEKAAAIK
jgi:hypothetical protein